MKSLKSRASCAAFCVATRPSICADQGNNLHRRLLSFLNQDTTGAGPVSAFEGQTMDQAFSRFQPVALSLFRFITGLLLLQYGIAKIFKFPVVPMFAKIPPLITTAGSIELVGGALLMIGLFTRPVAFILSGLMACAYFLGHMFKGTEPVFLPLLNGGTAAILFCFACLYIATAGGGPISADAAMRK
jgi:putative oxidoreductase